MEVITVPGGSKQDDPWLDWLHRTWAILRIVIAITILLGTAANYGVV